MIILLNKPFNVLCQFTDDEGRATLANYIDIPNVYAAGRLDRDSEGLLILTDDGKLQHKIAEPKNDTEKTYWAQVEGEVEDTALQHLRNGIQLNDGMTRHAEAVRIDEPPGLWPRDPPIRTRRYIPTSWIEIKLREGRNRQVRRMTAATGHSTLRLIRTQIGQWSLGDLQPGQFVII